MRELLLAAQRGDEEEVRRLVQLGENVNCCDKYGVTCVHLAASYGHEHLMQSLVQLGADVNALSRYRQTPFCTALVWNNLPAAVVLVEAGAKISSRVRSVALPGVVTRMVEGYCKQCGVLCSENILDLFSLTRVVLSVLEEVEEEEESESFFVDVSRALHELLWNNKNTIDRLSDVNYSLQRRVTKLALDVHRSSLLQDSFPVSQVVKAQRFAQLVCIFFDSHMLRDLHSLRFTCKANHLWKRFPLPCGSMQLETHLIECFVSHEASRFVSTQRICFLLNEHECSTDNQTKQTVINWESNEDKADVTSTLIVMLTNFLRVVVVVVIALMTTRGAAEIIHSAVTNCCAWLLTKIFHR